MEPDLILAEILQHLADERGAKTNMHRERGRPARGKRLIGRAPHATGALWDQVGEILERTSSTEYQNDIGHAGYE